ncbi:MAG: tetratricopeptide repeat protein [Candidatus Latescibacteria bacterium]|nr:tetratricopeptide repeat protein [Candidatus Latescibacterota bacterium]NIM21218.1 tetratricopeptide repeat protein [Candidatus Latescibacterota bacterium]NIM65472.1 tetratricopeptide repeat protein [Candidatus Latescibacterota bacterium]NIO01850.1 tetratricopeptide repeat protein [Candidatus Latescibacterota bacterium]NIO28500.1 tetratricopeptide repeat protein [Candidatus Latescibacterota bacterium]
MKKSALIGLALIIAALVAFFLITGLKHVPQDNEGLLISKDGRADTYERGWHFIRPGSGKFVLYPVGEINLRYPKVGLERVLLKNGREAEVAFSFRIHIPPGSARHLYETCGEKPLPELEKVFRDAVELQAATIVPPPGDEIPRAYSAAVAKDVQAALSEPSKERFSLLSARIDYWGVVGGKTEEIVVDIAGEPLRKIIFIGVDGADWTLINPLIEKGRLPNFKKLVEGGAWGPLRTIEPMLSPLIWTSMATGKLPEDHGILNFTVVDPETGEKIPITRLYRKVDAFWNTMSDYDRSVDIIGWLATYPAEAINGAMVTDRVGYLAFASPGESGPPPAGAISPSERYDEIISLLVKSEAVPYNEIERIIHIDKPTFEENKILSFDPKNPINNMILIYASSLSYQNIALHLLERDHPDFFGVYFELVDAVGHLFMTYAPPKRDDVSDEEYKKYKDAVDEAYVIQDGIIGEILARSDENTVVMIASDHGFKSGEARLKAGAEIWGGHAAHWHRIEGIICLYGKGIRKGHRIEGASILDVAPTILALSGFPLASDMPGKVLEDALEPSLRESLNAAVVATLGRERADEAAEAAVGGALDEAAMKKLEALGYITPENPNALNNLGQRYQMRGEFEKAIVEYKKALTLKPNFASALNNIGICYGSLGRYAEAEGSFLRAIEFNPEDIFAMNNLAVMYLKTRRFDQARLYAEKAIGIEPKYTNAHITLGSVLATIGELDLAEEEFQTALEIEPGNLSAQGNLEKLREEKKRRK